MKTIREILGRRDVFCVEPDLTVQEVVAYLCEQGVGAVAVCENDHVVGVFSERDLMRRVVNKGMDPAEVRVREVMTKKVYSVALDTPYPIAKSLMLDKNFRHLVVLDEEDRLQGFVSMRELIEADLEESRELIRKLNDEYYDHHFQKPAGE